MKTNKWKQVVDKRMGEQNINVESFIDYLVNENLICLGGVDLFDKPDYNYILENSKITKVVKNNVETGCRTIEYLGNDVVTFKGGCWSCVGVGDVIDCQYIGFIVA